MENTDLVTDLQSALDHLADAVDDLPAVAGTLRGYSRRLGASRRAVSRAAEPRPSYGAIDSPLALRSLLFRALDVGALDPRGYDVVLLAEARRRQRRTHAARGA